MLQILYKKILTPFKEPFTTAHGLKTHQPALLIAIGFRNWRGVGEAPAIHYYGVQVETMIDVLLSKIEILQRYAYTEPDRFWHFCEHLYPENSFLLCALDMAYWDMYAQSISKPMYQIWNTSWNQIPPTTYTLGYDTPEKMLAKLNAFPWPLYKIKITCADDIDLLRLLRQHTQAALRVDANGSLQADDTRRLLPELHALKIDWLEQPLPPDQQEDMKALKSISPIPLIADESCVTESDVLRCAEGFHGINIKLTKCGGITPALRMIQEAKKLGLRVMMGCMNETEPGSYAIAQFLPQLDDVDMDGPLLLDVPPLEKLYYQEGYVHLR